MNPQFVAANYTHSVPEKLTEYFLEPFTNLLIVLILILMFANIYMFKKLRKIKRRDYVEILNLFTLGIYSVCSIISSVLVSRLGPHGKVSIDDCDSVYMFLPRILFNIVAIINIIYFIVNIVAKLKNDKEYKAAEERGYFSEEKTNDETEEKQNVSHRHVDMSSFMDNVKSKIDIEGIKDKVNNITEDIKEMVNNMLNKDE